METICTDGISHFAFQGGVVKLKLASIRPDPENQRRLVASGLIEMSRPSLLRFYDQLGKVIQHTEDRAALSQNAP